MKTTVLRKMEYMGTYIYVLQYLYTFQYLFAWDNEVYRQEMEITPDWYSLRRWAWWIGYLESPYTKYQLERGEQIILSGAMKSIDLLKDTPKEAGYEKRKKEVRKNLERMTENKCVWQGRSDEEGKPIYLCVTHNKVAPLEENPKHE